MTDPGALGSFFFFFGDLFFFSALFVTFEAESSQFIFTYNFSDIFLDMFYGARKF